jgi:hypothetical protein
LVDTDGIEQDELHKKSIATQIERHIDSVCAVLVLVNGAIPRITVATDYALSTLSAIFPKALANNIAFMFTNISSPLSLNFPMGKLPEGLKDAPQFFLNNPITFQKSDPRIKDHLQCLLCKAVLANEQKALETLVDLFDWFYGLEPQPTQDLVSFYEMFQTIEAVLVAPDLKKAEINKLMIMLKKNLAVRFPPCLHLALKSHARWTQDMDAFSNCNKTVNIPIWKQQPTIAHKIDNQVLVDEYMKNKWDEAKDGKEKAVVLITINEMVLHDLNQVISGATSDLVQLAERYARLSLAGSRSAQVRSAVNFLEEQCYYISLKGDRTAQERAEKVKESLDHMKWKLELLNEVEKHRKECQNSK